VALGPAAAIRLLDLTANAKGSAVAGARVSLFVGMGEAPPPTPSHP